VARNNADGNGKNAASSHLAGHRQRLRERLLKGGVEALLDYEILEILLWAANPRGDTKPLAKRLIGRFGSLGATLAAPAGALGEIDGLSDAGIAHLRAVRAAAERMAREVVLDQPVLGSWNALLDYCRIKIAHEPLEQFHLLFLDRKNRLIADERQQTGTVDHTPIYPREIVKRALELGASALILVHNHPSGDPSPSRADIDLTREVIKAVGSVGLVVHDHLVVAKTGTVSLKSIGAI
jgi:DNA repair protein RadC